MKVNYIAPPASKAKSKSIKRLALFAGYDEYGLIHDYVIYLVHGLSNFCDIAYYSDNYIKHGEKKKLSHLAILCEGRPHGRYDFGSWAELIKIIGWNRLDIYDEIILLNDSCYGPIYNLKPILDDMSEGSCDFWSMTANSDIEFHLQSYFMVFKKKVINSKDFRKFWLNIEVEENYDSVVKKYEIGLSRMLISRGFRASSYIESSLRENLTIFPLSLVKRCGMPLIKVKVFKDPYIASRERISLLFRFLKSKSPDLAAAIAFHQGNGFLSRAMRLQRIDQPIYWNNGVIRIKNIRNDRLKISFFNRLHLFIRLTPQLMKKISRLQCLGVRLNDY